MAVTLIQRGITLSRNRAAKAQKRFEQVENTINFNQVVKPKNKVLDIIPKSLGQEQLLLKLYDDKNDIIVAIGPAGTGKTYLAMQNAVRDFKLGKIKKLILTRPAVAVEDERHGFLPGNIISKMEPWTRPLLDVLKEHYTPKDILSMMEDGIIEISPLAYMRGRTFKDSWIIADEMQNATPGQVKMLLTRIGENSRIVVTGDIEQTDRRLKDNGLVDLIKKLETINIPGIVSQVMTMKDIKRHHIIDDVLQMYR